MNETNPVEKAAALTEYELIEICQTVNINW